MVVRKQLRETFKNIGEQAFEMAQLASGSDNPIGAFSFTQAVALTLERMVRDGKIKITLPREDV